MSEKKLTPEQLKEAKKLLVATASVDPDVSKEARKAIADLVGGIVQPTLEQYSTVRRIFNVVDLSGGGDAKFPVDIDNIEAWVLPSRTEVPQNIIHSGEISIQTFPIATSVEWELSFARRARFDVVGNAMKKMQRSIITEEERSGWTLISGAIDAYDGTSESRTVTEGGVSGVTKGLLNLMWTKMQDTTDFSINLLIMSPNNAAKIREWSSSSTSATTHIDPVTERQIWTNFGLDNVWGATVMVVRSQFIGDTYVYGFDTSAFGYMPERDQFQTYDDPSAISNLRQKVIGVEEVGFGVTDPRACVRGQV